MIIILIILILIILRMLTVIILILIILMTIIQDDVTGVDPSVFRRYFREEEEEVSELKVFGNHLSIESIKGRGEGARGPRH